MRDLEFEQVFSPIVEDPLSVVMWTMPRCTACVQTYRRLCAAGVQGSVQPLDQSPDIKEYAADAGFTSAPVVLGIRPDGTSAWWAGFNAERIREWADMAKEALHV